MTFNSDFTKIIDGSIHQYDQNNELLKIVPLIDMDDDDDDQCYELQVIHTVKTNTFQQSIVNMTGCSGEKLHQFLKNTSPSTPP